MPKTNKMRMITNEEFLSHKNNKDIMNQIYCKVKRMGAFRYLSQDEIEDAINLSILKGAGYHVPDSGNSITTNIIHFLIKILQSEYKKKNRERYKGIMASQVFLEKSKRKVNDNQIDIYEMDMPEKYKDLYKLIVKDNEKVSSVCRILGMKKKRVESLIKEMLVYLN